MALDKNHKDLLSETFIHFIETIKKHDESIYFWIQGGALRRCLDGSLNLGEINNNWPWPIDIDVHTYSLKDYFKLKDILINKLGFRMNKEVGTNLFLKLFDVTVDLIKPYAPNAILNPPGNFMPTLYELHHHYKMAETTTINTALVWVPFTIECIALDSNLDLFFHENFSNDIENRELKFVKRNDKLIDDTIKKYCKDDELFWFIELLIGKARVQTGHTLKFRVPDVLAKRQEKNSNYKSIIPRMVKHIKDGYTISDDEYLSNKIRMENLKKHLSKYLRSYVHTGWWQESHYYGIVDYEMHGWYLDHLGDKEKKWDLRGMKISKQHKEKHLQLLKVYENILEESSKSMNFIKVENLKSNDIDYSMTKGYIPFNPSDRLQWADVKKSVRLHSRKGKGLI